MLDAQPNNSTLRAFFAVQEGQFRIQQRQILFKPNEQPHDNLTKCIPAICIRCFNQ